MTRNVIIISRLSDVHALLVAYALRTIGINASILSPDRIVEKISLDVHGGRIRWVPRSETEAKDAGRRKIPFIPDKTIFWMRRLERWENANSSASDTDIISAQQNREALHAFYEYVNMSFYCLNDFNAIRRAKNKYNQLRAALASGLKVPKTVIGKRETALGYLVTEGVETVVEKALKQIIIPDGRDAWSFYTRRMNCNLAGNSNNTGAESAIFATILQEYIKPKYEIRCSVFGHDVQAAKISAITRDYQDINELSEAQKRYEPLTISEALKGKIHSFMKRMGLEIGCIDFVVDHTDEVYFLEINESGQFAFVERELPSVLCLDSICRLFIAKSCKDVDALNIGALRYEDIHKELLSKLDDDAGWVENFALI